MPPRDDVRGSGFASSGRGDFGDRPTYESRPEVPLPTSAPYTAFVGNLSFDTSEGEIADFFGPSVDRVSRPLATAMSVLSEVATSDHFNKSRDWT